MNTGAFHGTVRDPSGAAVAGAKVRVERVDPPLVREVSTNAQGEYIAQEMAPGAYRITFSAQGFEKSIQTGLVLSAGQSVRVDSSLRVGAMSDSVTVSEKVSTVETSSPNIGSTVYADQVTELALNTRSFTQLLILQPGVASNQDQDQGFGSNTQVSVSFNGAPQNSNNITLDGARNLDPYNGNNMSMVNLDAIAEVRVERNAYAAEYGRNSGGQVNVVSKSGTNKFHGSAFEFFRNDKLNARNFFSVTRPKNRYNNFGWTLGGPMLKNRLFFFVSNEYRRIWQNTSVRTGVMPTDAEISGRFPGRTIRDPLGGTFAGGIIPASRLDPQAQLLLLNYYLRPTPGFTRGTLNFSASDPDGTKYRSMLSRLDYVVNSRLNVFGRFNLDSTYLISPFGLFASNVMPNVAGTLQSHIPKTANFTANWIPSASTVNTLTVAHYHLTMAISNDDTASRARVPQMRIPRLFNTVTDSSAYIPSVAISGYSSIYVNWPQNLSGYTFEIKDTFSWVRNRHNFKFGGSIMKEDKSQNNSSPNNNGSFTFNSNFTGQALADMLLGKVYQYTENSDHVWGSAMWTNYSLFAQDDWRVNSKLNISLGVRWEVYPPEVEADNKMSFFLPSAFNFSKAAVVQPANGRIVAGTANYNNGIVVAGAANNPFGRSLFNSTWNTVAPRAGFAYSLNKRGTRVARGGIGMFHDRWPQYVNATRTNWPINQSASIFNTELGNPGGGETVAFPLSMVSFSSPWRIPYMVKWSLGFQQQLPLRIVLDTSYVGSRGLHLVRSANINQPQPTVDVARNVVNVNAVRPYSGLAAITSYQTTGDSVYHSLQVSGNRRFHNGMSLQLAYTFSKTIDDNITPTNIYYPNSFDRGVSNFDRKHVLTISYVYQFPLMKKRARLTRAVLGAWQASGITSMQSGNPFSVLVSSDRAGIGGGTQRAIVANGPVDMPHTFLTWFDTKAFSTPAYGTFGNQGRNLFRAPSWQNWDLSVSKWATLREGIRMQVRAEGFNFANHTQWLGVGTSVGSTNFGQITSARYPRYMQLAMRLTF